MPGRPRGTESQRRTQHLLRLLHEGATLHAAAGEARVKPDRVLRLLDEPEFRAVAMAIMDGRLGPVAVVAAPTIAAEAA